MSLSSSSVWCRCGGMTVYQAFEKALGTREDADAAAYFAVPGRATFSALG